MPQRSTPYYQYALILLWGVACMVFFCFYYPHHLFYQEQNQLFLLSADYLCTYWQKPAWLACMALLRPKALAMRFCACSAA